MHSLSQPVNNVNPFFSHLFLSIFLGVSFTLLNMRYQNAQTLYNEIKTADNKELYAICQYIVGTITNLEKEQAENKTESNVITSAIDFDDPALTRTHTLQNLYQMMLDGNATAGKLFAEYTNIRQEEASLTIQIVRFQELNEEDLPNED